LLKSVAGAYESESQGSSTRLLRQVSRPMLANSHLVDPYFAQALSPATQCWLIDGGQPERLAQLLESGCTLGTQVTEFVIPNGAKPSEKSPI
jgi:aspartokinase-like uncharacterized kinase